MSEKARLLYEIGMTDFVAVEMMEYLDTHPYDKDAMAYFNYYMRLKNGMLREFAEKYYPLTLATADNSETEWEWALQNPPWEGGK